MTLGQLLKSKRLESGRSLEQVAASTKIHIKILNAIEGDQYSELPARTFTRGFIVNYAKALKLDSDQLLKDHQEYLEQKFSERPNRDQGHQGYAFEGKELEQNRRWMVIGASIALIFAVAVLLLFKPQNHKHKEMNKEFEEESSETADDTPVNDVGVVTTPVTIPSPSVTIAGTPVMNPSPGANSVLPGSPLESPTSAPLVTVKNALTASSSIPMMLAAPKVTPTATVIPTAAPKASATPSSTPAITPAATATPTATPTPTVAATPTSTPAASPSASPSPAASPTPTAKADKLNKGDDIDPKDAKRKVTFEAMEDVWVRYRSDNRPMNMLILRKGRFLVVKAKEKLYFETNHPEAVSYKTRGRFGPLSMSKGEVTENGAKAYEGGELGTAQLPEEVPASPHQ